LSTKSKNKNNKPEVSREQLSKVILKPRQEEYKNVIISNKIIFCHGPAGTSKTFTTIFSALCLLAEQKISNIILTKPIQESGEKLGFLPGDIDEKVKPFMESYMDSLTLIIGKELTDWLISTGIIRCEPLAYMRGRTFKNSFIIADEMQNSSPNQMLMLSTRIGINSRMVITGDLQQSDKLIDNGLKDFINKFEYYTQSDDNSINEIKLIKLNTSDVLRSPIVENVIKMYNYKKSFNENIFGSENLTNGNKSSIINNRSKFPKNNNDAALIPIGQYHGGF